MIGKEIIRFDSIESTNSYIKRNHSTLNDGTIVLSKTQSSGRGRSDHTWMSEEGNLYFSFIVKGFASRSKIFELLARVSVAVVELLRDFHVDGSIKYPNDVLVDNKKICGILIESSGTKEIDYVVVGVGINVNQVDFKELSDTAVSMKNTLGNDSSVEEVLVGFIKHFNLIEEVPFTKVFEDYLRYSLIIGKRTLIDDEEYLISGISEAGKLIIENDKESKEISLNSIQLTDLY